MNRVLTTWIHERIWKFQIMIFEMESLNEVGQFDCLDGQQFQFVRMAEICSWRRCNRRASLEQVSLDLLSLELFLRYELVSQWTCAPLQWDCRLKVGDWALCPAICKLVSKFANGWKSHFETLRCPPSYYELRTPIHRTLELLFQNGGSKHCIKAMKSNLFFLSNSLAKFTVFIVFDLFGGYWRFVLIFSPDIY